MREKVEEHLAQRDHLSVLDIGSQDINGCFRPIFDRAGWTYTGIDVCPGKNVDIVMQDPYSIPFADESVDVVISGSAFEHIEFFWLTWQEVCRITRKGGHIILVLPSRGPEHRFPIDAWRFYSDAMASLAKYTGVELVEAHTDWEDSGRKGSGMWGDTVGVFRVPEHICDQESVG